MIIKKINWIGLEEAIITVSDGNIDIDVYAHPFSKKLGVKLKEPLLCFDPEDIMYTNESNPYVVKIDNNFKQLILGKVVDIDKSIVEVGKIKIDLDGMIPKDINNGNFIVFKCNRLDIME